jgi:hypothetical protein
MGGSIRTFLAAHFKISGYSSVKLTQKLEREVLGSVCFKTESLSVSVNCSYSLLEKSSIQNEPVKGFFWQVIIIVVWWKIFGKQVL